MKCEICGEDIGETIVNLSTKQPDGRSSILVCLKCAEQSAAYCKKHERPHLGFGDDDTTACMLCIEELVNDKMPEEVSVFDDLEKNLPREEMERLVGWANGSSVVSENPGTVCVLRAIATKALRMKITFEEVKVKIIEEKSIELILPGRF